MKSKLISVLLLLSILIPFTTVLNGCSKKNVFIEGAKVEETIKQEKDYTIGSLNKTGWQLNISKTTFDNDISLTMKVLSAEENSSFKNDSFEFIGTIVQIAVANQECVRLNNPVRVTMQLPKENTPTKDTIDNYMVGYWTGEAWEYIFPSLTDLYKGTVTFETYHFSSYAAVELTDEQQMLLYSQKMALQTWEDDNTNAILTSKTEDLFKNTFEAMGVTDTTMQGKLFRSILKENNIGSLIVSAERGDVVEYGAKCGEMAANALLKQYSLDKVFFDNIASKGSAAVSGIAKSALQLKDGNYTDAAKELSSAFIGYFPAGRAYQATIEIIDAGISTWKDYEIDSAYKSYQGLVPKGTYSFELNKGDWEALAVQMRGGLTRIVDEAKDTYCSVNKITRSEFEKDKTLSDRIAKQTEDNLKAMFKKRLANETAIKAKEGEYQKLIEGFKRDRLLTRSENGFDVDHDIQDRLRTLFAIRSNILDMMGGKLPDAKIGESAEANMNEMIAQWIRFGPQNRAEFYKWMKEKSYITDKITSGTNGKWMLVETVNYDGKKDIDNTNKDGVYSATGSCSPGSYSYDWTYLGKTDTYYSPPVLNGESWSGKCTYSTAPSTMNPGEIISLNLYLAFSEQNLSFFTPNATASADIDKWDVEPGFCTAASIPFVNKDLKSSFTISTYKTVKIYSVSESLTAKAPTGKLGDKIALRTTFYPGARIGTCYIYEYKN